MTRRPDALDGALAALRRAAEQDDPAAFVRAVDALLERWAFLRRSDAAAEGAA